VKAAAGWPRHPEEEGQRYRDARGPTSFATSASRRCAVVLVILGLIAGVAAPNASAARYRTFPTCNAGPNATPDNSCFVGDAYGAVFIAKFRAHVHYRLCFRPPGDPKRCVSKRTGEENERSPVGLFASGGGVGTWRLTWKHGGHVVDRDRLHVAPGD